MERHQLHGPQGTLYPKQSDTSSETPWTFNQLPQDLAPTPLTSRSTPWDIQTPEVAVPGTGVTHQLEPTLDPKALAPPPILDPSFTHQWASTNPWDHLSLWVPTASRLGLGPPPEASSATKQGLVTSQNSGQTLPKRPPTAVNLQQKVPRAPYRASAESM